MTLPSCRFRYFDIAIFSVHEAWLAFGCCSDALGIRCVFGQGMHRLLSRWSRSLASCSSACALNHQSSTHFCNHSGKHNFTIVILSKHSSADPAPARRRGGRRANLRRRAAGGRACVRIYARPSCTPRHEIRRVSPAYSNAFAYAVAYAVARSRA